MSKINAQVGDLVEFERLGERYVCGIIAGGVRWLVTKDKAQRTNPYAKDHERVDPSLAVRIVEEYSGGSEQQFEDDGTDELMEDKEDDEPKKKAKPPPKKAKKKKTTKKKA